jgi:hypothetical protein
MTVLGRARGNWPVYEHRQVTGIPRNRAYLAAA